MTKQPNSYRVGDIAVTRVTECVIDFVPSRLFPNWDERALAGPEDRLAPNAPNRFSERLVASVHTWILKTLQHTILVDTGIGNGKTRSSAYFDHLDTPYLDRLAAAGVAPEQVDYVLLTHLHTDHVGWNTTLADGRWKPTFPNATYFVPRLGHKYFSSPEGRAKPNYDMYEDSVLPVIEAGRAKLIGPEGGEVLPGIVYVPTPGHSVDHMSIVLSSSHQEGLIAGDLMHNPVQVYRPDWSSIFCAAPEEATQSRMLMIEYCANRRCLYFSSHFAETSVGRITRTDDGYEWRFE